MPPVRTEITEIVTGLATLGAASLESALAARPDEFRNVTGEQWDRLVETHTSREFAADFERAWANGIAFLAAPDGLRNRRPVVVEWKGPYQTPGYDLIPADLRIDHVYLVSCKYLSRILFNASPSYLFDRLLADRRGGGGDWYLDIAPDSYRALYGAVRGGLGPGATLPDDVADLDGLARLELKHLLRRAWPGDAGTRYRLFCTEVAEASAAHWRARLESKGAHEEMLWRMLRLAGAPYFVLGASPLGVLRLRIYTPWDWRQEFSLASFRVWGDAAAGQPVVRWRAIVARRAAGDEVAVDGHVEIRWSHGRFAGQPEAKVYLDTPHEQVPGYAPLDAAGHVDARQLDLLLER